MCLGEPWARGPGESTTARDGLPDARLLALACLGWVVVRTVSLAFRNQMGGDDTWGGEGGGKGRSPRTQEPVPPPVLVHQHAKVLAGEPLATRARGGLLADEIGVLERAEPVALLLLDARQHDALDALDVGRRGGRGAPVRHALVGRVRVDGRPGRDAELRQVGHVGLPPDGARRDRGQPGARLARQGRRDRVGTGVVRRQGGCGRRCSSARRAGAGDGARTAGGRRVGRDGLGIRNGRVVGWRVGNCVFLFGHQHQVLFARSPEPCAGWLRRGARSTSGFVVPRANPAPSR